MTPLLRRPQTIGGVAYLLVVAVTAVGVAIIAFGPWRRGVGLIGIALLFAAASRLVLPEDRAGMLRVRSRWFDVPALAGVGLTLLALAASIPDQPAL